jgi:hypothetical protein
MREFDKLPWVRHRIGLGDRDIECDSCKLASRRECDELLTNNWREQYKKKKNLLFWRLKKGELIPANIPGISGAFVYSEPPFPELWRVPCSDICDFVPMLGSFGFPHSVEKPVECLAAVREMIATENSNSGVSITQVDEHFITLEKVDASAQFDFGFISRCISFDKYWFGALDSEISEQEVIRNWKQKRFATIGCI